MLRAEVDRDSDVCQGGQSAPINLREESDVEETFHFSMSLVLMVRGRCGGWRGRGEVGGRNLSLCVSLCDCVVVVVVVVIVDCFYIALFRSALEQTHYARM